MGFEISGDGGASLKFVREISAETLRADDFFSISVDAKVDGFAGHVALSLWPQDLIDFESQLQKIHSNISGQAELKTIEDQIFIKISLTSQGTGTISGYLKGPEYRTKLKFEFRTDQSFLPPSIEGIGKFIQSLQLAI